MNTYDWYSALIKPEWAPPSWLFGPVWTVLYIIIAVSFGMVFYKTVKKQLPASIALPFILNLVFNLAFSPLQFSLQNNFAAAIDIFLILVTLMWSLLVIRPRLPWVAYINIPYLLWVSFATVLQFTITIMN